MAPLVPSVLVVDDFPDGREMVAEYLAFRGFSVLEAATGAEAIYCRPPQDQTDSRLKGPKVCLTVGKWKELRAQGLDVSADGSSIVAGVQRQMEAAPGLLGMP